MKKLCFLLALLALLLCGCLPDAGFTPTTTPYETTPVPEIPDITTPESTTPEITDPEDTTPEVTTPDEPPHEHSFGNATVTQVPTCVQGGMQTEYCSCGETREIEISATGRHEYLNNECVWCQKTELTLIPITSRYDTDGDGSKDVYYFAAESAQRCSDAVWLWAGDYDKDLSVSVSKSTAGNIDHWYVGANTKNKIVYHVTVPESGTYEMILHMRLKDGQERGAKYTFNADTSIEESFETTHAFSTADLAKAQNDTVGTYMYGIRVYLQGGENIFTIEAPAETSVTQHFREFFFVKINEGHTHNFTVTEVIREATCGAAGQKTLACACGEVQTVAVPVMGAHNFQNDVCTVCGTEEIILVPSQSIFDADGEGEKDVYNFSPELSEAAKAGIHVWAGDYDKKLSTTVNTVTVSNIAHWYVDAGSDQMLVYRVTVPESGTYEMILHMRLKDGKVRGAKYSINEGSATEQSFQTSHAFATGALDRARNDTVGTYMYGIRVQLVAGENIIKIAAATDVSVTQHYRDFYFVKVGELHQHDYVLRSVAVEPTCAQDGEVIFLCTCGVYKSAVLAATGKHIYAEGICIMCKQNDRGFGIVEYHFLYDKAGFAGGTIEIIPEANGVFDLYWADENGKLANYTKLGSVIAHGGKVTRYSIYESTAIPVGATRLIAVNTTGIRYTYSYTVPAERRLTSQKQYTFGALADTHQGTRYGPESLSYERLVNAGKILSEKDAILIGIAGDITYINLEFEYALHADAVKEIFGFAPDMPVFATTGNHESRDPYPFDKEMYLKYTRNLVDYNSDLTYIYSDGNDLDYVVELPDGSVIIFLHQVYYDYNKSDSRLMDDYQLDWLGNRLEQYKDRAVFLFFHSQMQGKVGDFNDNADGLDMCTYTEDYKRLDAYFKQYTNVIFFNGHSHGSFDNVLSDDYRDRVFNTYSGEYATLVHIPSLAQSQIGHIVHVYEDCIVFEGYDFANKQTFAYATFIIEK